MTRYDWQEYIAHYGIMGQRWGIRNYQNLDGSLTPAGRQRYGGSARAKARMYNQGLKSSVHNIRRMQVSKTKANEKANITAMKLALESNLYGGSNHIPDAKKVKKLSKELDKYMQDLESSKKMLELGEKEVERILSMVNSEGYNISIRNKTRYTMTGRQFIAAAIKYTYSGHNTYEGKHAFGDYKTTHDEYKVRRTRYSIV